MNYRHLKHIESRDNASQFIRRFVSKFPACYPRIDAINLGNVPVMSKNRHIPRKEQAILTRKLFRQLGIKGVSVTTPSYSMAQAVDVGVPRIVTDPQDYVLNGESFEHHCYDEMPSTLPAKIFSKARIEASEKIEQILAIAFPSHNDRSDSQSDYFDFCWSVR